jgi:hypothetical protein
VLKNFIQELKCTCRNFSYLHFKKSEHITLHFYANLLARTYSVGASAPWVPPPHWDSRLVGIPVKAKFFKKERNLRYAAKRTKNQKIEAISVP